MSHGLVERLVAFCRALRARGLLVTTGHAFDAVNALRLVGLDRRDRAYCALRCVLASRPEDFPVFDELFDQLFAPPRPAGKGKSAAGKPKERPRDPGTPSLSSWGDARGQDGEEQEIAFASDQRGVAEKDFSGFTSEELEEIERIARRIARRLSARPSRRWKPARSGARVDLRRTLRKATAGELLDLRYRRRKPRKTRIVALCDVSGSMDIYSRFLLQFLYALQGTAARVESFVFSTELRRVTDLLRAASYGAALSELSASAREFSGGTRIGACVASFNLQFPNLVDSRTVVVILSDGWDTGEPQVLGEGLALLKRRSRRLVWLNPLLGSPDYQPLTLGMQAALPHLSVFAPAHNLASLRALERHLT